MKCWIALKVVVIASLVVCQGVAQTTTPPAGNDYSFNVSTTQPWTDTGVDLQTGDVLNITASGAQSCDPQGVTGASTQSLPVATALPGALIAKLQAQGTPVLIGSSKEVNVDAPGHLFLGINARRQAALQGNLRSQSASPGAAASSRGDVLKQQLGTAAEIFLGRPVRRSVRRMPRQLRL